VEGQEVAGSVNFSCHYSEPNALPTLISLPLIVFLTLVYPPIVTVDGFTNEKKERKRTTISIPINILRREGIEL